MNDSPGKLPDFLLVGFQKCATSTLSRTLDQHSKMSIARTDHKKAEFCKGKEINFFSDYTCRNTYKEGIDWYKSHFIDDGNLWGECSPNYTLCHADRVIDRMKLHLKDSGTKFIFSIRNPIYRTSSSFNHYVQNAKNPDKPVWNSPGANPDKDFMWNLKNSNWKFYISYIRILKMYEEAFGKENIHILIQEKLKTESFQTEYDKLFKFFGINSENIKNLFIHKRDYEFEIKDEEVSFLKEYAEKDVNELFDWLGYEIKEWTEFC